MSSTSIQLRGVRTHNLKNIDVDITHGKLTVITGLSGSGKSSLAFNTIYAEGQRRYIESISAYARRFLPSMEKPELDSIKGLAPTISIEQKVTSAHHRSTVGTCTEIYDHLCLLFSKLGQVRCPTHHHLLTQQTLENIIHILYSLPEGTAMTLLAPLDVQHDVAKHLQKLQAQGFSKIRLNGTLIDIDEAGTLIKKKRNLIDVVIDRFKIQKDQKKRLTEACELAHDIGKGLIRACVAHHAQWVHEETPIIKRPGRKKKTSDMHEWFFSTHQSCPECGYSLQKLEPRLFSFNNPLGACPDCNGLGFQESVDPHRLINPNLTLHQGGIRGWGPDHRYYYDWIHSLAKHDAFDINQKFFDLPLAAQKRILYGTGKEKIPIRYHLHNQVYEKITSFEGVVHNIQRRFHDQASRDHLEKYIVRMTCEACKGSRLRRDIDNIKIQGKSIGNILNMTVEELCLWIQTQTFSGHEKIIAKKITDEIIKRLLFMIRIGLGYLTLNRAAHTLSGGEFQRIRLVNQIGSGLTGVLYVLDEPSIGLHSRDNERLINALFELRDLGNTVIVVEHDKDIMEAADEIIDLGPGAGQFGGYITAQGSCASIMKNPKSLTGAYLSGVQSMPTPTKRKKPIKNYHLKLKNASGHNLKNVDVSIPLGLMVCITGVSGSGKSTLVHDTLYPAIAAHVQNEETHSLPIPAPFDSIEGIEHIDRVVLIDQNPIGRTPRSSPATYVDFFTSIRELFACVPEARARGYQAGRFSFNTVGGRCEVCKGDAYICVEMHFLPDVYITCEHCQGRRYRSETLEILYKGLNIHEVLSLSVQDAYQFFSNIPKIKKKLKTLIDVGLGYISIGQHANTLSGGEAQRIKLAKELSKRDTGKTLYIFDEPTTGLHMRDVECLLHIFQELRNRNNTVLVIEHNIDMMRHADWLIDLGPEGGSAGGHIIAQGSPEDIIETSNKSYTAKFLRKAMLFQHESKRRAG